MRYSTYIMFEDTHTTSTTVVVPSHKNLWPVSSDLRDKLSFRWTMSWMAMMVSSSDAVLRTIRETPMLATIMISPCLTMDSTVQPLWTTSKRWLRRSLSYTAAHAAKYDCFQRSNWQSAIFFSSLMNDANVSVSC
ncbi:hypothetical protein Zm00014a_002047 [Zea mays]|uniref:Uncharacterized protein n=1 Tax=Zea mays TaxID=4577 RepID=A0A3L6GDV7_MAIZE|nr:hypothetical protein Zm00014a_002047 [Zea mays]